MLKRTQNHINEIDRVCITEYGQAQEVGSRKHHEVQKGQEQGPAPGSGQPRVSIQAGG